MGLVANDGETWEVYFRLLRLSHRVYQKPVTKSYPNRIRNL